jgi:Uncharacterized ABC-type transport system, periplasmic component/surface lipoprotein
MAGVVAGIVTTMTELPGINPEKLIGAVGGDDDIVIRSFVYGYDQGAKYVDPEIQVKTIYVGTWDDPVKGNSSTATLLSRSRCHISNCEFNGSWSYPSSSRSRKICHWCRLKPKLTSTWPCHYKYAKRSRKINRVCI